MTQKNLLALLLPCLFTLTSCMTDAQYLSSDKHSTAVPIRSIESGATGSLPLRIALTRSQRSPLLTEMQDEVTTNKIVGGVDVLSREFPWQVSLVAKNVAENQDAHFCGGSLVRGNWVLTAAHCVDNGTTPNDVEVLVGTDKLTDGGERKAIKRIIIHPDWNKPSKHNNDIALLELQGMIPIVPVPIVSQKDEGQLIPDGTTVTVIGWGFTKEGGTVSPQLKKVQIPVVPRKTCQEAKSYGSEITDNMICAGFQQGGKDSCQGDSGGPLIVETPEKKPILVGAVSFGEGCARKDKYGVYTRLAMYQATWAARYLP